MEEESVVHSFDGKAAVESSKVSGSGKLMTKKTIIIFVVIAILGIGTGVMFASKSSSTVAVNSSTNLSTIKAGTVFGSDAKLFKDSAEGTLKEGGIEGEGSYHLVRKGGDSQNVYLTSSVLDLGQLVGRKVKVWGQTNAAQKAGWLMDVGRAQIIN